MSAPPETFKSVAREQFGGLGEVARFSVRIVSQLRPRRLLQVSGEVLRQCGILCASSALVIIGLVFIIGLQCGLEGAYIARSYGAPAYAGWIAAWCDLRELVPYAFGYMMAAKVGTGLVAEIGSMRISEEIDALEVMGTESVLFLCSTRLVAAWLVLPFIYAGAVAAGYLASGLVVVEQIGGVSPGAYLQVFWQFQNPADLVFSVIKAMSMVTAIVLVGCYFGYHASGGPVGVGRATAQSMVLNLVVVHVLGMLATQIFWGTTPRAPIGG